MPCTLPDAGVLVLKCIGCGAISTPQPCLGTCVDRRLDLVAADEHATAVAAVDALEAVLAERERLVGAIAALAPAEWDALRTAARAALHTPAVPEAAEEQTTWACDSCGRIEAPQPCIGVCVRPETAMVPATEHRAVIARAVALADALTPLAPPLRQLAWTTPRPGRWEETAGALRAAAAAARTGAC